MNIDKISSRAKQLAEELGVEFTAPDYNVSKAKAQNEIRKMNEYLSKKEQYDSAIKYVMENFSKDDILAFIQNTENHSPK